MPSVNSFLLSNQILVKKTGDNYTYRDCLNASHQNDPALEIDEFGSSRSKRLENIFSDRGGDSAGGGFGQL
jgi:hypothetical protein